MVRINTKIEIVNLKGAVFEYDGKPLTVGVVVAETLAASEGGGKMKLYGLARRFYDDETVEVDESDRALILKVLQETRVFSSNIVTGQVIQLVEEAK